LSNEYQKNRLKMNLKTKLFLLKYQLAKNGAISQFDEALKIETLSEKELKDISFKKFKTIFDYAYTHIPYYTKKYKAAGIQPNDILTEKDIQKIPILTRKDLVDHYNEFYSTEIDKEKLRISTTGGSTGTPVKVGFTKNLIREIPKWRILNWWGLSPNVNMATFYRNIHASRLQMMALNFIYYPQRVIRFDATQINEKRILDFINKFNRIKPDLIHGYVGALDTVANYLLEHNIHLEHQPKVIWLTAAPITKGVEAKIAKAFQAPVCDQYGCSEMYFIAAECPQKEGLHIFADSVYVEILGEDNKPLPTGEYGKVTFTNLNEFYFPLIRYQNGDESRMLTHKCSCGMNLPLMDKVKGRISEKLIMPDGTILSGEYLTCLFDNHTDEVKQFQIIQRKDSSIDINILFFDHCMNKKEVIDDTFNKLKERIHNDKLLRINEVTSIENKRGKLKFIISER